ncbi:MAG TPA: WhiB family transcriptional regulator [Microlunatus sp.]|nr:WhiB family transcriptional regulator [Microlunatus sp.]
MTFATPETRSPGVPHRSGRPRCIDRPEVFQNPLLEEPPASSAPATVRRHGSALERQAAEACHGCPLLAGCLYDAVVRHDVAGYAGGTTARERQKIRVVLGISVQPENLDTLAGVPGGNRPVDHDEVVRLRAANPDESLERIAQRLGCSLSTVKRHLRRERGQRTMSAPPASPVPPSLRAVVEATRIVLDETRSGISAAA